MIMADTITRLRAGALHGNLGPWRAAGALASAMVMLAMAGCGTKADPTPDAPPADDIISLERSTPEASRSYSADGSKYLINKEDANGIAQVYVGSAAGGEATCITDTQQVGGPAPGKFKMQPIWHPGGKWIFVAVERDSYVVPWPFENNKDFIEGELQCGLWTNMWVVKPDGSEWHRLTDFRSDLPALGDGYTGPAITPDGTKAVWSQIVDGNILAYWPFGKWELTMADITFVAGVPTLINKHDITPLGMHWNEPGNFHPDNRSVLLSGSTELDAQGQDQYILDIHTGHLTNLTNTPTVWDEHGMFSRDGTRIIWMSAYPYRDDPNSSTILGIKTEFMRINSDGTGMTQLTHFLEPGYPEYSPNEGIAAVPGWSVDGKSAALVRLTFPNYTFWKITFGTEATTVEPAMAPPVSGG
jgi:Tol biopolymer transport system component